MLHTLRSRHAGLVFLGLGLVAGLLLARLWPSTPLHAVATDRSDTFLMATGALDEGVEGVYLLDCVTGELRGAALSRQTGKFHAFFRGNAANDLGVDQTKNPHYMMVTGVGDLNSQGGARIAPSKGIIYVAEISTGKVAAYMIQWSRNLHTMGQRYVAPFTILDMFPMRQPAAAGGRANE
jgi:hypothetical protein